MPGNHGALARFRARLLILLAALAALAGQGLFATGEPVGIVKLRWDSSDEPDIAGYRVHYGPESGVYTEIIDVGFETRAQLNDLPVGGTYFSAVTAYNTYGLESDYSNEITFTVLPPPESRDSDGDGLSDLYESTHGDGADLEPLADPDLDGLVTLAEFAHGMDPSRRQDHPLSVLGTAMLDGLSYLSVRYFIDPVAERFVTVHLERSTDCRDPHGWERAQTTVVSASVSAEHPDLVEIVARSKHPMTGASCEFLRFAYETQAPECATACPPPSG